MRAVRIAGALLALGALVAACSDDREPGAEPTPAGSDPTASPSPSIPTTPTVTDAGTGGLTIRYLDADGKIKTVRVEDFPR